MTATLSFQTHSNPFPSANTRLSFIPSTILYPRFSATINRRCSTYMKAQSLSNGKQIAKIHDPIPFLGFDTLFPEGAQLVTVPLPLGVFLDETADGSVFIDEIAEDGNAQQHGLLSIGSTILAVSIPFGEAVVPVPKQGGLDMVATQIETRQVDQNTFNLVVLPASDNRIPVAKGEDLEEVDFVQMRKKTLEFHRAEYYVLEEEEEEEEQERDLQALRDYGFDV